VSESSKQEIALVFNAPNAATAVRLVLAGVIAWLLYQGGPNEFFIAGILLLVAGITDGIDGFLARRLGQSTLGGSIFDLVTDQMLIMPTLILSVRAGLFAKADSLIPFNPYPYAVITLIAGATVLVGVVTFLWKNRTRVVEFPPPTKTAKLIFCLWIPTLAIAVLGIGPGMLLAAFMYVSMIVTLIGFATYLKKASYVFTD
jgi:cardiolipin synthase